MGRGGAPPQEVLGPSSEGPRPLLGHWNLLIYLPIWQFFECKLVTTHKIAPKTGSKSYLDIIKDLWEDKVEKGEEFSQVVLQGGTRQQ